VSEVPEQREFVPDWFDPPTTLRVGELRLEPLHPEHNQRDYAAWTSSVDHIRRTPGFNSLRSWPREMTLAENLGDLERHHRDFQRRTGFTFTVLAADDDVVGCLYIYPADDDTHDAQARSWVRESEAALDAPLRQAIADWLSSDAWPFVRPRYEPLLG
jgi:hypothetical protein